MGSEESKVEKMGSDTILSAGCKQCKSGTPQFFVIPSPPHPTPAPVSPHRASAASASHLAPARQAVDRMGRGVCIEGVRSSLIALLFKKALSPLSVVPRKVPGNIAINGVRVRQHKLASDSW